MPTINKYHGNYNKSNRGGTGGIKYFVVHYTATMASAKNNCIYFSNGNRNASADMFVDRDGSIWEYNDVSSNMYTWHCGDGNGKYGITNPNSVGVEVVSDGRDFTEEQIASLASLYKYYCDKLGRKLEIVRHYDASRKSCPAPYIDANKWATLKTRIAGGTVAATPGGSSSSSSAPTATSGYNIWMQAKSNDGKVWPVVHNNNDNAGIDKPMIYLAAWTSPGTLRCQARTERGGWLPELINPSNINDLVNGAIGDGSPITGIRMYYNSPDGTKAVYYRVKVEGSGWLPWMMDHKDLGGSKDTFAGNGKRIQRIEAYIGQYK